MEINLNSTSMSLKMEIHCKQVEREISSSLESCSLREEVSQNWCHINQKEASLIRILMEKLIMKTPRNSSLLKEKFGSILKLLKQAWQLLSRLGRISSTSMESRSYKSSFKLSQDIKFVLRQLPGIQTLIYMTKN